MRKEKIAPKVSLIVLNWNGWRDVVSVQNL